MTRTLFTLLIYALSLQCEAQSGLVTGTRDSLLHILSQNVSDSIKSRASFQLSDEWSYSDTVQSKQYLKLARQYAGSNRYLLALEQFYTGQLLFETNKSRAEYHYLKTDSLLSAFHTREASYFRSRAWHNYGTLRQYADDEKTMLTVLTDKAIPLAIESGNKRFLAQNYADLASIFNNQWQYPKAEFYFAKAIRVLEELPETKPTDTYIYVDAISNLLNLDKLEKAKAWLDKIRPGIEAGSEYDMNYRQQEAIYFRKTKNFRQSLASLDTALAVTRKTKNNYDAERILMQRYKTLSAMGDFTEARNVMQNILDNKTIKFNRNRLMHFYEMAETNAKLGDMKMAYEWQKKFGLLLDSVNNSKLAENMNELEIKFRNTENQNKIRELNTANERAKLEARNSHLINWLLGLSSLFLFILAVIGWFFYQNARKLSAQTKWTHQQELKDIHQQQQISITQAMLSAQEEERNRIARDLHDGLGGMLATVKLGLSDLAQDKEKANNAELNGIIGQLDSSARELRHIAYNMMPEMLLKLGLEASLRDLCESLMSEKLEVGFQCLGIKNSMPRQEQINIYRIIQELLTNVVRHADAKAVLLQCAQNEEAFFITIEDDGKGFDPDHLNGKQGLGLSNIRNRVQYLKGQIEILSGPRRQGTSINIELNVTA